MGQGRHTIGYDQATLCLLLITEMTALSKTFSLQTLSDQEVFNAFLQTATSHCSPAFTCHLSSISTIRLHTEEYSR